MSFDVKEYQRQYRQKNKERLKELNRKYYLENHADILKQKKEYHKRTYVPHPVPEGERRIPLEERFWNQVSKGTPDICWNWTGAPNMWGYGQIRDDNGRYGKKLLAHRVSWTIHNGPIPYGLYVLHKCDNPLCVNPNHLWLGTLQDNALDMCRKGRHTKGGWGKNR